MHEIVETLLLFLTTQDQIQKLILRLSFPQTLQALNCDLSPPLECEGHELLQNREVDSPELYCVLLEGVLELEGEFSLEGTGIHAVSLGLVEQREQFLELEQRHEFVPDHLSIHYGAVGFLLQLLQHLLLLLPETHIQDLEPELMGHVKRLEETVHVAG